MPEQLRFDLPGDAGDVRGKGRWFRMIRGPADRPSEWNVYYDNGRVVRFRRANRSGWGHSAPCGPDGEPLGPLQLSPSGSLLDPADFPPSFRDSSD